MADREVALTRRIWLVLVLFWAVATALNAATLRVRIEGIDSDLQTQVRAYLAISREIDSSDLQAARLQRLHNQAPEQIKTALQAFGFYRAEVHGELVHNDEGWEATYQVSPGAAIRIKNLHVSVQGEGEQDPAFITLLANFPLAEGQVLEHARYESARDILLRLANQRGYLDATLTQHEVKVDLPDYSVSINLALETGQRYHFGEVFFTKTHMDEQLLKRYVKFKTGDFYSPIEILKLQTALGDSGYFQRVEVRPNKENPTDNQIPIEVDLQSRLPRQWRFGLGYATDTGPRTTVNHTRLMGDEGDKLSADLLVSQNLRRISTVYSIPLQDPVTEQLSYGWRYSNEITRSYENHITGVNASYSSLWRDWRRTVSLLLDREVYIVAGQPEATKQMLYPLVSLDRVRADDRLQPRHGSRVHLEWRGANEGLFSDTNFSQFRAGLKWIDALGPEGRVLLRGDFGTTNVAYLDRLPASQRFFAGGDNSVRGYSYQELGPVNAAGVVEGGKHLMVGSIELEHNLSTHWSAASFYDVGNAVNELSDKLARGAGFGFRWKSPVGPVRLDFAWALSKPQDRFRLHIIIGPDL
ncbi:MAG: outer membrane protein assembly factor [Gammaproteobacteria bacterium]|nr:outer membrane protein assembly factor [Gammaproteobacteria bacterium]